MLRCALASSSHPPLEVSLTPRLPQALLPSPSPSSSSSSPSVPAPSSPATPLTLLDPSRDEARSARSFITLSCLPALGTSTSVRVSGVVDPAALAQVRLRSPSSPPSLLRPPLPALSPAWHALTGEAGHPSPPPQTLDKMYHVCGLLHGVAKEALLATAAAAAAAQAQGPDGVTAAAQ